MENTKKWYQKTGWIVVFLIFFFPVGLFLMWKYAPWNKFVKLCATVFYLLLFYVSRSNSSPSSVSPQTQTTAAVPTISEEYKNKLAKTFCDTRSKPYTRAVNFADFILMYEKSGEEVTLRPANAYPTLENCKRIANVCLDLWNKDECEKIAEGIVWIGMTADQLILSAGLPNDQNNTVGSWGVHSQWVYGLGDYFYLEGKTKNDLKVTSWQD
jgi:hypothetical protein